MSTNTPQKRRTSFYKKKRDNYLRTHQNDVYAKTFETGFIASLNRVVKTNEWILRITKQTITVKNANDLPNELEANKEVALSILQNSNSLCQFLSNLNKGVLTQDPKEKGKFKYSDSEFSRKNLVKTTTYFFNNFSVIKGIEEQLLNCIEENWQLLDYYKQYLDDKNYFLAQSLIRNLNKYADKIKNNQIGLNSLATLLGIEEKIATN